MGAASRGNRECGAGPPIDATAVAVAPEKAAITRVLEYLDAEMPADMCAEVARHFPLVRPRCAKEDGVGPVIQTFLAEPKRTVVVAKAIPMPIARVRLSKSDLAGLHMKMTHGRTAPGNGDRDAV
jgi:hypothetical protein